MITGSKLASYQSHEKKEEAEMIEYIELGLYQSHESRSKKNRFTEDSLSPSEYIS